MYVRHTFGARLTRKLGTRGAGGMYVPYQRTSRTSATRLRPGENLSSYGFSPREARPGPAIGRREGEKHRPGAEGRDRAGVPAGHSRSLGCLSGPLLHHRSDPSEEEGKAEKKKKEKKLKAGSVGDGPAIATPRPLAAFLPRPPTCPAAIRHEVARGHRIFSPHRLALDLFATLANTPESRALFIV